MSISKKVNNLKSQESIKKAGGVLDEFKTFISRGNVMDLAVGVIVGGAFTSIVNSLVSDILMPIIGTVLVGINFKKLGFIIPWGNNPYKCRQFSRVCNYFFNYSGLCFWHC